MVGFFKFSLYCFNVTCHSFSTKLGKPKMPKGHQVARQKAKTSNKSKLPQRNLAAKYFGVQPQSWPDSNYSQLMVYTHNRGLVYHNIIRKYIAIHEIVYYVFMLFILCICYH